MKSSLLKMIGASLTALTLTSCEPISNNVSGKTEFKGYSVKVFTDYHRHQTKGYNLLIIDPNSNAKIYAIDRTIDNEFDPDFIYLDLPRNHDLENFVNPKKLRQIFDYVKNKEK